MGQKKGRKRQDLIHRLFHAIWQRAGSRMPGRAEVERSLYFLFTNEKDGQRLEQYYREKICLLTAVLGVGFFLTAVLLGTSLQKEELLDGFFLRRREAAYQKELEFQAGEGEFQEICIEVEPRQLSAKESRELLEDIKNEMEAYILGENRTLEEVRSDLNLISEVEGTPVTLTWELDSYEVLNLDGSIRPENLEEEGRIVELTAHLSCNGETAVYRTYAKVLPPVRSLEERFEQELQENLEQLQEEGKEEEQKELPREVQGKTLVWKEKRTSGIWVIPILTMACMPLLYMAKDQELKKQLREREQQMSRDYAQIVSKLVLLMGAGATIRNAWEQLVRDYQRKRERNQIAVRYAYEEMAFTCHEMQNGMAETKAYENFGQRCCVPCYLKLSALLEQNLKKGNRGLTELLKIEVQEAFEQRKALAKQKGEEASTKLLLPLVLMLAVVMILIMVPAGMSMQVQ